MLGLFLLPFFAILNRARGSGLYNFTSSTSLSRLTSTLGMSALLSLFEIGHLREMLDVLGLTWGLLMIWCVPAWDKYWGACIGTNTNIAAPAFAPVDWIMSFIPLSTVYAPLSLNLQLRLWGLIAMGLRQSLAALPIAALAALIGNYDCLWVAALAPLLGLPYFVLGFFIKNSSVIAWSEYTVGAMLGAYMFLAAGA